MADHHHHHDGLGQPHPHPRLRPSTSFTRRGAGTAAAAAGGGANDSIRSSANAGGASVMIKTGGSPSRSPLRARKAVGAASSSSSSSSPRKKKGIPSGDDNGNEREAAAMMMSSSKHALPRTLRKMKSVPALALRAAAQQQQQQHQQQKADHQAPSRSVVGRKRSRTGKLQPQSQLQSQSQSRMSIEQGQYYYDDRSGPPAGGLSYARQPLEPERPRVSNDATSTTASSSSSSSFATATRQRRRFPSHSRSSPNLSADRAADPFAIVSSSPQVDHAWNPWGLARPSEFGDQSKSSLSSSSAKGSLSSGKSDDIAFSATRALIESSPETPLLALGGSSRHVQAEEHEEEEEDDEIVDPKIVFSKERFLKRHSQDFSHLYGRSRAVVADGQNFQGVPGGTSIVASEPVHEAPEPDAEDERRALEEARRMGREKRRSWMLQRAGLAGTMPLSVGEESTQAGLSSSSAATTSASARHHRRTSSTTFLAPSARAGQASGHVRQTTLFGGPKPLTLVAVQNRRRLSQQMQLPSSARSPFVEPFVTSPTDDEVSMSPTPAPTESPSAIHEVDEEDPSVTPKKRLAPPSSYSPHRDHPSSSPTSSVSASQHRTSSIPPHLRGASASSHASSGSLSSLGHIIAGYSPGASTSSCSSGADHIGGPRELAPENFNFRMSISDRNSSSRLGTRADSRLTWTSGSLRRQTSMQTESRLSQMDSTSDTDEEVPVAEILEGDDREARLVRRRARAFLMAGLKLERNSVVRPDSGIAVEQQVEDGHDTVKRSDSRRRAGIIVQGEVDVANPDLEPGVLGLPDKTSNSRKRYSMLRREKAAAAESEELLTTPSSEQHGSSRGIVSIAEAAEDASYSSTNDLKGPGPSLRALRRVDSGRLTAQPGISISVFDSESEAALRPTVDRLVSDESNGMSGWQTLDSSEAASRLFWHEDGAEPSRLAPKQDLRKVRSDGGMRSAYRSEDVAITTPITPTLVHADANGASPGQKEKSTWAGGMRGWLRKGSSSTKAGVEGETEKGFGLGRGEDDRTTPATTTRALLRLEEEEESQAQGRAPREKKSWRSFLVQPLARDESPTSHHNNPLDDITVPPASLPPTSATLGTSGASPLPSPSWFTSPSLPPPTADLRLYSPSSANSYSPPTPAMFATTTTTTSTTLSTSGHRESRRAPISIMQIGPSPHILSPTPDFPQQQYHHPILAHPQPTAKPYERRSSASPPMTSLPISPAIPMTTSSPYAEQQQQSYFANDTIPPQQRSLHGLGLGVEMPLSDGLCSNSRTPLQPPNAPEHWQDDLARHAFALIQLSQQARQQRIQEAQRQSHPARVGLSGNQSLTERIFGGLRKRQNAARDGSRTPEAADVAWQASQSTLQLPQTPSELYRDETRFETHDRYQLANAGKRSKERPATPTTQQEVIFRQKPGGLVPAKLFFMLGFLLGPCEWAIIS